MVVDASYSRFRADDKFGQRPEVKDGDISRFDAVTNAYVIALPTYRDLATFRDQVMGSMSYFAGRHDIRFGYQFMTAVQKSSTWSTSGMRAVYRSGRPDSVNTYNVPITSTSTKIPVAYEPSYRDHGLYIQDKWTPARKLTINVGLRYESTYGWQPAACQVETIFVAGQCFPRDRGRPGLQGPRAPRLGRLRPVRRRQDGAEVLGQPLRPADHAAERPAVEPARRHERYAALDGLRRGTGVGLRSQRAISFRS